jgi:hypothetical protein
MFGKQAETQTPKDKAAEAEAAVQKKKDDEMKAFLTIPPDGSRPVNPFEPDPPPPDADAKELEAQHKAASIANKAEHEAEYKSGRQVKEEEEKAKSHTIGGRK